MHQRGTTLLEVVVAAAIVVLTAAGFFACSQANRAFAMRSATMQVDAVLAYAQALAVNGENGATLVFDKRRASDGTVLAGFVLTVYSGRPSASGALQKAPIPPLQSSADAYEAELGGIPFTIFLNGAGHASAMRGAVGAATMVIRDPGCPSGETKIVLTFSDLRATDSRSIPCNVPAAGPQVEITPAAP